MPNLKPLHRRWPGKPRGSVEAEALAQPSTKHCSRGHTHNHRVNDTLHGARPPCQSHFARGTTTMLVTLCTGHNHHAKHTLHGAQPPLHMHRCWTAASVARPAACVVCIDARGFADAAGSSRGHLGLSGDHMWALASAGSFQDWMRRAKASVLDAIADPHVQDLTVVVYCKQGCHRSVSCGELLAHTLFQVGVSQNMPQVQHISEAAGLWWQQYCGPCDACCTATTRSNAARRRAVQIWRGEF